MTLCFSGNIRHFVINELKITIGKNETRVMTSRDKCRLQAAEMGLFRSVMGITRRNKFRNDEIRNKLHVESLNDTVNTVSAS
jgi:hypothetical protein